MFRRPNFMACTLCRSKFLDISFQTNFMWTKSFGASMDQKCGIFPPIQTCIMKVLNP